MADPAAAPAVDSSSDEATAKGPSQTSPEQHERDSDQHAADRVEDDAAPDSDTVDEARDSFWRAHEQFDAGEFEAALALFERSYSLLPQPEVLYNIALSHHKLGHCERARDGFTAYLKTAPAPEGRERAERQLELLDEQCAATPAPEPAPPEHPPAAAETAAEPTAPAAPTRRAPEPALNDQPASYWTARRTAGWSALGVATVASGVAVYFELRRQHFYNQFERLKRRNADDAGDDAHQLEPRIERARDGMILSLVTSAGFAGLGCTLLLWPSDEDPVSFVVSPSGLTVSGHF